MRERLEAGLMRLGYLMCRRAWWVIAAVLILISLGLTQTPGIEIKTSTDDFLRPDDPVRATYNEFLAQFGRDDTLLVALECDDVFDLAFLEELRELHREIEENVPHVREVKSLINARETRGEKDRLIVGELLERWPQSHADLDSIRQRALANALYIDFLVSADARLTTLTIELEAFSELYEGDAAIEGFGDSSPTEAPHARLSGIQEREAIAALRLVLDRYHESGFEIYAAGSPIISASLMEAMITDVTRFTSLSLAVIVVLLTALFRHAIGVLVPLSISLLALLGTAGLMGTLNIPAMPVSEIVPSFLLSVGIGGTVHLLTVFFAQLAQGTKRDDAIAYALGHSGLPIIMTSVTTAGGLVSFAAAKMQPIAVFGTVAPMGILVTLALTLTLVPALLAVAPVRTHSAAPRANRSPSIRLLTRAGAFATARPGFVAASCMALLAFAVPGILRLQFNYDALEWLADGHEAKIAAQKIDDHLGGGMTLEVVVHSRREDGLKAPVLLNHIEQASLAASALHVGDIEGGNTVSIVDIVKEIHQALDGGHLASRVIPDDPRLVAQELLLFESSGSDDLEEVVDTGFQTGRVSIKVPYVDGSQYVVFGEEVSKIFDRALGEQAHATITGMMAVMGGTFKAAIETMVRSYGIALLVITPLMILTLGSLRLGFVAMIPNLFPIVLTIGLMGWLAIPLETFSLLIGSIALGLAVDDTIHFMHGFRRAYSRTGDVEQAVHATLSTTGQALLFTSIVLALAFFVFAFSQLDNLRNFGVLSAFSISMAFLADILLAPALMKLMARYGSLVSLSPSQALSPQRSGTLVPPHNS